MVSSTFRFVLRMMDQSSSTLGIDWCEKTFLSQMVSFLLFGIVEPIPSMVQNDFPERRGIRCIPLLERDKIQ